MIYQVHKDIFTLLKENLSREVFTSCEAGFFYREGEQNYLYTLYLDKDIVSFNSTYYFDLASLTKIMVTLPCIWSLISEKKINIDTRLADIYRGLELKCKDIQIDDLLNHISGLPAHKYFIDALKVSENNRLSYIEKEILKEICKIEKKGNYLYSDLGYILLAIIVEKISGKKLERYWFEKIYVPLNLYGLFFLNEKKSIDKERFISTGKCPASGNILQGIVHDDNCRLLGGVSGHAGLFGNCCGVLDFLNKILLCYKEKIDKFSLSNKVLIDNINKKTESRRFGFDTPAEKNSCCGDFFSQHTIGHLGFTGTSAWLDLEKEAAVVLLTNRTYKGNDRNSEEIRLLRPQLHNMVMKNIPHKG